MLKDATISDCGQYRYGLTRIWDYHPRIMHIIMLNPSTADAEVDDPTIRRCIGFAQRENYGGIQVSNLFAFRATSPADMKAAIDPVGPANDSVLEASLKWSKQRGLPVLCAWGAHGSFLMRDDWLKNKAHEIGADLVHLGLTKAGQPKHPLYVKSDQPFGILYPRDNVSFH
jgi:hypothetical protein